MLIEILIVNAALIISDETEGSGKWTNGSPCYAMAKNLSAFFPYPDTLWEIKLKGDGLIYLPAQHSGYHTGITGCF